PAIRLAICSAIAIAGWFLGTHLLARYLLPLVVFGSTLLGIVTTAIARRLRGSSAGTIPLAATVLLIGVLVLESVANLVAQRGGAPLAPLAFRAFAQRIGDPAAFPEGAALPTTTFVNFSVPEEAR